MNEQRNEETQLIEIEETFQRLEELIQKVDDSVVSEDTQMENLINLEYPDENNDQKVEISDGILMNMVEIDENLARSSVDSSLSIQSFKG